MEPFWSGGLSATVSVATARLRTRITMILKPPEADQAAANGEEGFVDLVAAVVAD
jgi:hypothetical protein